MTYNRSQIAEIVKQQIKSNCKSPSLIDSLDLTKHSLAYLGFEQNDVFDLVLQIEDVLGVSFDDKDFKKKYSDITFNDIVDIATKKYNRKMNRSESIGNTKPVSGQGKIINYATIEQSVRNVFGAYGITDKQIVPTKSLKSFNFDFMDALDLMADLEHEFNLPLNHISGKIEKKYQPKAKRFINGIYDFYSEASYNDIINILCEKFKIVRPQAFIVKALIDSKTI